MFDAKRLIGRDCTDKTVQSDIKYFPLKDIDKQNKPLVQVRPYFRLNVNIMVLSSEPVNYWAKCPVDYPPFQPKPTLSSFQPCPTLSILALPQPSFPFSSFHPLLFILSSYHPFILSSFHPFILSSLLSRLRPARERRRSLPRRSPTWC